MQKLIVVGFAALCLIGASSLALAEEAMKGEMGNMQDEMKTENDAMKGDMKAKKKEMKSKKKEQKEESEDEGSVKAKGKIESAQERDKRQSRGN